MDAETKHLLNRFKNICKHKTYNHKSFYEIENGFLLSEYDLELYSSRLVQNANFTLKEKHINLSKIDIKLFLEPKLVIVTLNNKLLRWKRPSVLTWNIDVSSFDIFPHYIDMLTNLVKNASAEWNQVAKEKNIINYICFKEVANNKQSTFKFVYDEGLGIEKFATAFYPNAEPAERIIYVGDMLFRDYMHSHKYDPQGVIRHELGHVLGFRHEHIRINAEPANIGLLGAQDYTEYDNCSVMHDPIDENGTYIYKITETDKLGFEKLYNLSPNDPYLTEFST